MKIRCVLDGLLLDAEMQPETGRLLAYDGDESFEMEAVEAVFYELVSATREEIVRLEQACYRLLRPAADFHLPGENVPREPLTAASGPLWAGLRGETCS